MRRIVATAVAALALSLPDGAHAQGIHPLADAIAAGVDAYSDGAFAPLVCVRLLDVEGREIDVPDDLPVLVGRKLMGEAVVPPETKSLEGCASFRDNVGDTLPGTLVALLVTARRSQVLDSEVWLEFRGPNGPRSFACSLPDAPTLMTTASECRVR